MNINSNTNNNKQTKKKKDNFMSVFLLIIIIIMKISSTYYFQPATVSCAAKTCIRVADCVTCDEEGQNVPNTACIWRLKKCEVYYYYYH